MSAKARSFLVIIPRKDIVLRLSHERGDSSEVTKPYSIVHNMLVGVM